VWLIGSTHQRGMRGACGNGCGSLTHLWLAGMFQKAASGGCST